MMQDNLPMSKSLITSVVAFCMWGDILTGSEDYDMDVFGVYVAGGWAHFCLPQYENDDNGLNFVNM